MKKGNFFKNRKNVLGLLSLVLIFGFSTSMYATSAGNTALGTASTTIKSYMPTIATLAKSIGGIVGIIGGIRIYNKWSNGDQDINKELLGWGGACLFLILVPSFITAFFV